MGSRRLRVQREPSSLARARAWLDDVLAPLPRTVRVRAKLLAHELIVNSIRHAGPSRGGAVGISVGGLPDELRVRVCDDGNGFEAGAASFGMGLYLVQKATAAWGVRRTRGRFCVWFRMPPTA